MKKSLLVLLSLPFLALPLTSCGKEKELTEQEILDCVIDEEFLGFTALEDATITLEPGSQSDYLFDKVDLEYSFNKVSWIKNWKGSGIKLEKGQKVYIRNLTDSFNEDYKYLKFKSTGKFAASGNIMSLINFKDLKPCVFNHLFSTCNKLIRAPLLPATTLANDCYAYMFSSCQNLRGQVYLPAEKLVDYCYCAMFKFCHRLSELKVEFSPDQFDVSNVTNSWLEEGGSKIYQPKFYWKYGPYNKRYESTIPENWKIVAL